jgi:hypothetical protein
LIVAYTNLVWSAGAHSWFVLRSGGSVPCEILFDCGNAASNRQGGFWMSPGGLFTGGTTSTPPTATDSVQYLGAGDQWHNAGLVAYTSKVHVIMSTDGDVMMAVMCIANLVHLVWRFDVVQDPVAGWADGLFVWAQHAQSAMHLLEFVSAASLGYKSIRNGGVAGTCYLSFEAVKTTPQAFVAYAIAVNDFDGSWPIGPIGIWCDTAGMKGRVGTMTDLWWGVAALSEGSQYPVVTPYQFAQLGDMVLPWDSVTVIQTA